MKRWMICFGIATVITFNALGAEWMTSVSAAMDKARAERKSVLLDFTGSDWCGWCMKLKSEVLDQPEFLTYADANLILVEVDFPRHKEQSPDQSAANAALAKRYGIRGYPTIILIDPLGNEIGKSGYVAGGPPKFIASLEANPGFGRHAANAVNPADARPEDGTHRPEPAFVPVQPMPPMKYGDLTLKAISGPANRRLVLINDATLELGETGKVKTHDERIKVMVKEIRNDSVTIIVDGKERELQIGGH